LGARTHRAAGVVVAPRAVTAARDTGVAETTGALGAAENAKNTGDIEAVGLFMVLLLLLLEQLCRSNAMTSVEIVFKSQFINQRPQARHIQ
jgi:hypothetical protein